MLAPGIPYKFSTIDAPQPARAPRLGEHNRAVFDDGVISRPARPRVVQAAAPHGAGDPRAATAAGRRARARLHPRVGRTVLHSATRSSRRRRDARSKPPSGPASIASFPRMPTGKAGINRAGSFNQWNQGKRSLQLDLRHPRAMQVVLASWCAIATWWWRTSPRSDHPDGNGLRHLAQVQTRPGDAVDFRPRADPDPIATYVSLGQQTAARAGMFWITGYPNDVPRQIGISYADPVAGVFGAFAIISALVASRPHRSRDNTSTCRCGRRWK